MLQLIRDTRCLVPAHPFLNPPVKMELMRRLNDANTDTCLSLASTDMYTFSAVSKRWNMPFTDMCWFEGLVIQVQVPDQLKASFTVRITGHVRQLPLLCDGQTHKVATLSYRREIL